MLISIYSRITKVRIFNYSLIVLLLFCTTNLFGQEIKTYTGKHVLDDSLKGEIKYDYYLSKKDTIKHGDFYFQHSEKDRSKHNTIIGFEIIGNYTHGKKNGAWYYKPKQLAVNNQHEIKDHKIVYSATGQESVISANFNLGKANGTWTSVKQEIIKSEVKDTLRYFEANYTDGVITGVVKGRSPGLSFTGKMDKQGLLDGVWEMTHQLTDIKAIEYRTYENGVFLNHYFIINNDTLFLDHIGIDTSVNKDSDEIWEQIPLNSKYFQIIYHTYFGIKNNNTITLDSMRYFINKTNTFLEKALFSFSHNKEKKIWNKLSGSDSLHLPLLKIRKHLITKEEIKEIKNSEKHIDDITVSVNKLLEDPQLQLAYHKSEDVAYKLEITKFAKEKIKGIKNAINLLSDSAFIYINRNEIFPYLFPDLNSLGKVSYEYKNEKKVREFNFPTLPFEKTNLEELTKYLKEVENRVKELSKALNKAVEKEKKVSQLSEKEINIVNKKDLVLSMFNNNDNTEDYNEYHKHITPFVSEFIDSVFKEYASLELEEKIELSDSTLSCFNNMILLYEYITTVPKKLDRLDEAFTRTIWNPYTFTHMDERVKERVYTAFEEKAYPYLLNDLENNLSCNTINLKIEKLNLIYIKMMELREQDTKVIEKQLRRVSDPVKIIEILEVEPK